MRHAPRQTTGWIEDETSLREQDAGSVIPAHDKSTQELISRRHCTISKGGENANRTIRRTAKAPRTCTPKRTYDIDKKKTNDTTNHTKSHKRGRTTPQRPQHQKHNEHILSARVWDTFSTQPGRLSTGHRPPTTKNPKTGPHTAEIGRATGHKPRKLHTYQTFIILQYHLQG